MENKGQFDYVTVGLLSTNTGSRNYMEMIILKIHSDRASVCSKIDLNPWSFCYFVIFLNSTGFPKMLKQYSC